MAVAPAQLVAGTPRAPLPFGLFSVLGFREGEDRWENGVTFEGLTCEPLGGIGSPFCDPDEVEGLPKAITGGPTVAEASPFTVYGHHLCSPVGNGLERASELAVAHLHAREQGRVEQAIWTGDLGNTPSLREATYVDGLTLGIRAGVAHLEHVFGLEYGSLGVLHMSRGMAQYALSKKAIEARGGRLYTRVGTPVVAGSGYDGTGPTGADEPAVGQGWIYMTPPVLGYRSEVFEPSARPGDLLDRATNDLYAVAERSYVIGWEDCLIQGALIQLDGVDLVEVGG